MEALEASDARRREGRSARIEWLSLHNSGPGAYSGRSETMRIFHEAPDAFVDGHFVGALLLATSFIEHSLAEVLQDRGISTSKLNFGSAIERCRKLELFPIDWLDRVDVIRTTRNPYAHLQAISDPNTMANRYQSLDVHPLKMLEEDAREALDLMYKFFRATLRETKY